MIRPVILRGPPVSGATFGAGGFAGSGSTRGGGATVAVVAGRRRILRRVFEGGHGDPERLGLLGRVDRRLPRLLPRRARRDDVRARIDRHGRSPLRLTDDGTVAFHFEAVHRRGDLDGQLGELGLERVGALLGHVGAVVVGAARDLLGLAELRPRAGALALLLVAAGKVQHRPDAGIEAQALGQLGAGLGVLLLRDELLGLVEELLCRGLVGGRLRVSDRRRQRDGQRVHEGSLHFLPPN
jgi:hypothetical protein